ncbi:MAG: hypothetical protein ACRD3B_04440 [Candidatus Sulfotelmatobacter sp.]
MSDKPKKVAAGSRSKSGKGWKKDTPPRKGKIEDFFGLLAGKTKKVATIEEINQAVADGWAGLSEK